MQSKKGPFYLLHINHYSIYLEKFLGILHIDEEIKIFFFCPGPMVSFRGARKVSNYLVKAKAYPLEIIIGSFSRSQI